MPGGPVWVPWEAGGAVGCWLAFGGRSRSGLIMRRRDFDGLSGGVDESELQSLKSQQRRFLTRREDVRRQPGHLRVVLQGVGGRAVSQGREEEAQLLREVLQDGRDRLDVLRLSGEGDGPGVRRRHAGRLRLLSEAPEADHPREEARRRKRGRAGPRCASYT